MQLNYKTAEKEGIKTKPDRGLNQNRRMSHMGSTSIQMNHPWPRHRVSRAVRGGHRAAGRHFLDGALSMHLREWLIGRRGNILKRTGLPVVTWRVLLQPSGQRHHSGYRDKT